MSLINKMLQDLDARGNARTEGVPVDIKPVPRQDDGLRRRLPLRHIAATTAALLAVALGVTAWGVSPIMGKADDTPPATPAPAAAEPAQVTVAEVAPAPAVHGSADGAAGQAPEATPDVPAESAPPALARLGAAPATAAAVGGGPAIEASTTAAAAATPTRRALPRPAPAPASEAARTNTNTSAAASAGDTSWAVANARFQAEEARLAARWRAEEARLAALPPAERRAAAQRLREEKARAAVRARADAAWLAALQRKEAAAGVESAPAASAASATADRAGEQGRVDTGQRAEPAYRRALASLQEGRVSEAIAGLQAALRINPKHDAARQTLVGLLVEQDRGDEAMAQLQQALTLDPRQPALAMLLARLQIERGKSGIETLLRTLPYAAGNGDYAAFLAGALQRQGRYGEAAAQYRAALRAAPRNAVWWMGLGIAQQADGRSAEALDAFRQAKALGTLSPDLQSFVERKIEQLAR